jgi:uncharacterized membrane protein YhfC
VIILIPIAISLVPGLTALSLIARRSPTLWLIALLGGSGWLVALTLRSPLLLLFTQNPHYLLIASLMAGVFEECVRFLILRLGIVSRSSLKGFTSLGLGWGLTEALIIYAVPAYMLGTVLNYGLLDLLPGALERNSAIIIHLSLTLLMSLRVGSFKLLVLAITLHSLINYLAVSTLSILGNVWVVECLIAVISLSVFIPVLNLRLRRHQ